MNDKLFKKLMIGVGGIIVLCGVVIAIYATTNSPSKSNEGAAYGEQKYTDPAAKVNSANLTVLDPKSTWSKNALIGSETAPHKLVVYADLFCPYCRKSYEAVKQNMDDFKATFIDSGTMSYELRMTDLLTNSTDSDENYISTIGGEVVMCAQRQAHFWDYLDAIETAIYDDYYSKDIGDRHYDKATESDWKSHMVPRLETSYFTDVAAKVDGIDLDKLNSCISSGEGMKQLKQYSKSASKAGSSSFPSFFVDGVQSKELYAIDNTYDYAKFYKGIKLGLATKGIQ
jgi:protein-disulfide isomerase